MSTAGGPKTVVPDELTTLYVSKTSPPGTPVKSSVNVYQPDVVTCGVPEVQPPEPKAVLMKKPPVTEQMSNVWS